MLSLYRYVIEESAVTPSKNQIIMAILAIAFIAFVITSASVIYRYDLWTGSTDLYPTWKGAQLFWEEGVSPYDDRVGIESQAVIYPDGKADEGEDEVRYVYPFYMILYFGPLAALEFSVAASIFMEMLLIILGLTLALSLDTMQWLPKPYTLGLALITFLLAYFSVRGFLLGQPGFLSYGFHIIAYWSIFRGYDRLGGISLALSTIKPQTGFLIVPLLLIWAWRNLRWGMISSFVITFGALFLVSTLLLPTWFFEWIDRVFAYTSYNETIATVAIFTNSLGFFSENLQALFQVLMSLIVLLPVAWFWWRNLMKGQNDNLYWAIMLTMNATLLIAPRVATTSYIELYPVLLVTMWMLEKRSHPIILTTLTLSALIAYWALHVATVPQGETSGGEAPIVYVIFPVLSYFLLLWRQKDWQSIDILRKQETKP